MRHIVGESATRHRLAPLQEGMLFHSVAEPRPGSDFQQFVCTVAPGFDAAAFGRAWDRVVARHAILRTTFHFQDLDRPEQRVHAAAPVSIEQLDWSAIVPEAIADREAELLRTDRERGFDVRRAPLLRVTLCRLPDQATLVLWSFHHLLLDGRSFLTVLTDLFAFYEAERDGRTFEPPAPQPFAAYLEWLDRGRDLDAGREHFRQELAGAPLSPLPIRRAAPRALGREEHPSGRNERRLGAAQSERLRARAAEHGVTPNTLVQTAWAILLSRYGCGRDVVFGATRAGRHGTVPGADSIVGMTINTLPVRATMPPGSSVLDLARQLRDRWVAMRAHEHTPLTAIAEAAGARRETPLFDSILVVEAYDWKAELIRRTGATLRPDFRIIEWTNYPLTLSVDLGADWVLLLEHDRRLITDEAARAMVGHLTRILESLGEDGLDRPVDAVPILTGDERGMLLDGWNDTAAPTEEATLPALILRQAALRPDAVAVADGERRLSYGELAAGAASLAGALRARGAGPGTRVGVCLRRSLEVAQSFLAVLLSGAAYVPLDPDYPPDRLEWMVRNAALRVVVAGAATAPLLPRGLDVLAPGERGDPPVTEPGGSPDDPACVLYTSGSTGRPKGALLSHRGIVNHAVQMNRLLGLGPDDRVPQSASLSFDLSLYEIFGTWVAGGTLVIRPEDVLPSERFGPWLGRERVTVLNLPTALFHQWVHDLAAARGTPPATLRAIVAGGEKASSAAVETLRRIGGGRVRFVNIYGPTECSINATVHEPDFAAGPVEDEIPIGRPIGNVRIYLVDERGEPVPVGVPGELHIGGAGVGLGYLDAPELTAERFLLDPFAPPGRMYRTGDLARYRRDGQIEFLGRRDHQVKVRGFRVEPGEIEHALTRLPGVREAVVVARGDRSSVKSLVAYLIPTEHPAPPASELRAALRGSLPDFMVPAAFVWLDALPRSPNGKVDRARLPEPVESIAGGHGSYAAPTNPIEETLAYVFEKVLGRPRIGVNESFFDLGGHSLLALRILDEAGRAGLRLSVEQLFRHPTVKELALAVSMRTAYGGPERSSLVALREAGDLPPLYLVHSTPGDVLGYTDLVRELGARQPCFGFQSLGLYDPVRAHTSIEAMAAHYVSLLLAHQPEGPYHLLGWCYGGVVAFEMARSLAAAGKRVGLLGLIDAAAPRPRTLRPGMLLDRLGAARGFGPAEWLDYGRAKLQALVRKSRTTRAALEVVVSTGPLRNREQVSQVNLQAIGHYRADEYPDELVLFRRTEPLPGAAPQDEWLGWRQIAGSVVVERLPSATHESILRTPHVAELARRIRGHIDRQR